MAPAVAPPSLGRPLSHARSKSYEPLSITQTGRNQRINKGRVRAALLNAEYVRTDGRIHMLIGTDDRGEELEIGLIPDERAGHGWVIIHAMPTRYRNPRREVR